MIEQLTKLTKNVSFLIATSVTAISSVLIFADKYNYLLEAHAVLLGVSLFLILLFVAGIAHIKTQEKITALGTSFASSIFEIERAILVADVEYTYDQLVKYESLRLHQIQRVHELEERRIRLKLNSFTEMKLRTLLSKPIENKD